ncbi:hypothetical protein [Anaeromicropila populeti]|uniref:LPXTG-motif cell wall anchor domain-containing protein n=1 Tax=Anaeromicropila populeti TaxID=37658 RepID=A0A1I6K7Z6_9FIRM|nr:hypothetical protein [Anaeromicropila populeti]SFR87317.1 hypothetical protein SAMN05661086_02264 [Anaeromicropila populeti]
MKQILALILTILLVWGTTSPSVLASEYSTNADSFQEDSPTSTQDTSPLPAIPVTITLTSFDLPVRMDAAAFAVGTPQEELVAWFTDVIGGFTGYDADGNSYDLISGVWSLENVRTDTAGVYYAWASPILGTSYILAEGVSLPRQLCAVSIQTLGKPDINCCVSGRGFLHFPWVVSLEQQEQLEQFSAWLRQDNGQWAQLESGFLFTASDLQISQRIFNYGSNYELKVTYPSGQTGILSFYYDGTLSILDYSGGDRDGGDVDVDNSGTNTQPAPTASQTPVDSTSYDNPISGNPIEDNFSSEATEIIEDSSWSQSNAPDEKSSTVETQTNPAAPQTSSKPKANVNSANNNNDNNSKISSPETENSMAGTPHVPTESAIPAYSHTTLSLEESTSSEAGNSGMEQPKDNKETSQKPSENKNDNPLVESSESPKTTRTESYSPNETIISSLRLNDLCKEEESVVFGSGNLTVSIPSKLLLALQLSETDTLSVKLTQPESNQILLAVEVSGESVTELVGTVLRLRYIPKNEHSNFIVQNEAGQPITDVSFNGELLKFTVDMAGTYTILELSNTPEPQNNVSPIVLPVSLGLILAGGGITFFWRKRYV